MKKAMFFLVLFFLSGHTIYAIEEFRTNMQTTYLFDDIGNAHISHTIDLINNLSHIYPTTYNLSVSSGKIDNVSVSVMGDSVSPQIDQQSSVTSLHIPVTNPNIGKDQITTISISYNAPGFAEKIGNTVTITLPKTAKGNEAENFIRRVVVPSTYPELSYSTNPVLASTSSSDTRSYDFSGSGDQNLTLHFGDTASYDLNLIYLLKNNTNITAISELAIPPDTSYQKVILNDINPKPIEIVLDSDGNWLARYQIPPLSKIDVSTNLSVIVSPHPIYFDSSSSSPTSEEAYWEQSSEVKRLATNLKNPENLYNYLLETLTYDYTQITRQKRLGANGALANQTSAICTEFTDLFVATSRAMGIPSRAIIGYAVTNNDILKPQGVNVDILHAYPEYQDPSTKTWKSIDPTWGHTTGGSEYFDLLDFGHIAFVRWGASSEYPLPAGSYRENRTGKQIEVKSRDDTLAIPEYSYSIVTEEGKNYLINSGKVAIINEKIKISDQEIYITYLPPYGRLSINNALKNQWSLTDNKQMIIFILTLAALCFSIIFLFWKKRHHK